MCQCYNVAVVQWFIVAGLLWFGAIVFQVWNVSVVLLRFIVAWANKLFESKRFGVVWDPATHSPEFSLFLKAYGRIDYS